jgi:hypothetical protein
VWERGTHFRTLGRHLTRVDRVLGGPNGVREDGASRRVRADGDVAAATARSVLALRGFIEATAIHTLVRQRPPTPLSVSFGISSYCGENSEPGRHKRVMIALFFGGPTVNGAPTESAAQALRIAPRGFLCLGRGRSRME